MLKTKRFQNELEKIKSHASLMRSLSDEQLQDKTNEFKQAYQNGKSLDVLLPEAFAAIAEASLRVNGMYPYDVQFIGGIALHYGYLAEMNTGEGKTLTATLPLYLHAITGKSTILVTANDYLAYRDAEQMRPVFTFMGLDEKAGVSRVPGEIIENDQKRINYQADILYTSHSVLAFDYLLNNLVKRAEDRFLRDFEFIIIDEADTVLLDAAQMPLVISGSPRVQSNLYAMANFFVSTLQEDNDYEVEDKAVWLTDHGVKYAEQYFGIDHFYSKENFEINRHVTFALRAHALFEKDEDYVLSEDGQILLLDNSTGRSLPGMKLRGGSHQAIEEKEHLKLSQEQRSVASVTYQNLFLMFPHMCGMSGTISDAKKELWDVYHKRVVVIEPNKPLKRVDYIDQYYMRAEDQYAAAFEETIQRHKTGQPVLIVTATIQDTQIFSKMLVDAHVPHSVLNANNAYWEAEIIAAAGKKNAVTVSTGMAGRGTDIRLAEDALELGGLAVIGIGRMRNVRLERQARGRAGRQGNPGTSRFYVSLEDEIVMEMHEEKIEKIFERDKEISINKLHKIIDGAQQTMEEQSVSSREQSVRYDQILNRQREIIYGARNRLLDKAVIDKDTIFNIVKDSQNAFVKEKKHYTIEEVNRYILDHLSYELNYDESQINIDSNSDLLTFLNTYANTLYEQKIASFESEDIRDEYVRQCFLHAIDDGWIEEVDYLQQLQYAITTRGSAQRNPLFEYSREAYISFEDMNQTIQRNICRNFYLSDYQIDQNGEMKILFP